jgi:hypothetical protein
MHSIKNRKRKKKLKHGEVTSIAIKLDLEVDLKKLKNI